MAEAVNVLDSFKLALDAPSSMKTRIGETSEQGRIPHGGRTARRSISIRSFTYSVCRRLSFRPSEGRQIPILPCTVPAPPLRLPPLPLANAAPEAQTPRSWPTRPPCSGETVPGAGRRGARLAGIETMQHRPRNQVPGLPLWARAPGRQLGWLLQHRRWTTSIKDPFARRQPVYPYPMGETLCPAPMGVGVRLALGFG